MDKNEKNFWKFYAVVFTIAMVFILSGILANAYTAPNGIDYDNYVATTNYGNDNFRFKVYSNIKFCFCEMDKQGSEYKLIGGVENEDTGYIDVGILNAISGTNYFACDTTNYTNNRIVENDSMFSCYVSTFNNNPPTGSATFTVQTPPEDIPVFATREDYY